MQYIIVKNSRDRDPGKKMKKSESKTIIILAVTFMFLFLISNVYAVSFNPSTLTIDLNCGESRWNQIMLSGVPENCTASIPIRYPRADGLSGLYLVIDDDTPAVGDNSIINLLSSVDEENCEEGIENATIRICDMDYNVIITVLEDMHYLDNGYPYPLTKGRRFSIGNDIHFNLLGVSENSINYLLEGCQDNGQVLNHNQVLETRCSGEDLKIEITNLIPAFDLAEFRISFSDPAMALSSSDGEGTIDPDECVLGVDTMGAKVKRGSIFGIKTIDINSGKRVPQVSVTVLDQEGELAPLNEESSNTGFLRSMRLHEGYMQDIYVELEKEGCEPSTQLILFEKSYNDYIENKDEEVQKKTLFLDLEESYRTGEELTMVIKNLFNEPVAEAKIKLTKPSEETFEIKSDEDGVFVFTPEERGLWKVQASKENYISSNLLEFNVEAGEYTIVKKVDGEEVNKFKKGQKIIFEITDDDDNIIPLTLSATYDGETIEFISGISEEVIFNGETELVIPEVAGFEEESFRIRKDSIAIAGIIYWTLGIIGVAIIVFLFFAIKKPKAPKSKPMEIQLTPGA